jgi:hypothetical protein
MQDLSLSYCSLFLVLDEWEWATFIYAHLSKHDNTGRVFVLGSSMFVLQ